MRLLHKTRKDKIYNDPLISLIKPTIVGILLSTFCLVSMTWAWFTASVNTNPQTIQAATRSTCVIVYEINGDERIPIMPKMSRAASVSEENNGVIITDDEVVWELSPEESYEIIMEGNGSASTGYCKVALSYTPSTTSTSQNVATTAPTTAVPASSQTSTQGASRQTSSSTESTPSSASESSTGSSSTEASKSSGESAV